MIYPSNGLDLNYISKTRQSELTFAVVTFVFYLNVQKETAKKIVLYIELQGVIASIFKSIV